VETADIIAHARELIAVARTIGSSDYAKFKGLNARTCDFLAKFGGPRNPFLAQVQGLGGNVQYSANVTIEILEAFIVHLQSGLVGGISPKRQAELDVVSDFLEQAHTLLETPKVHPAAPAVIIGSTLEEFMRTWVEEEGLSLGGKNPSIDSYAKVLREAELISKQDIKDITSWAGIRNHASHGEWDELGDRARVRLMLDGVNLFMRRYTGE